MMYKVITVWVSVLALGVCISVYCGVWTDVKQTVNGERQTNRASVAVGEPAPLTQPYQMHLKPGESAYIQRVEVTADSPNAINDTHATVYVIATRSKTDAFIRINWRVHAADGTIIHQGYTFATAGVSVASGDRFEVDANLEDLTRAKTIDFSVE